MKKALGILSVLVLITVMMISCNAEQKLDDTVGVSFNVSSSRELSVTNESFVPVNSEDLTWYYHGVKVTDPEFVTGQSTSMDKNDVDDYWTEISTGNLLSETYVTFSQGQWSFEIKAVSTAKNTQMYYGKTNGNVLLTKENRTISISVSPFVSGVNGTLELSNVYIAPLNSSAKVEPNRLFINGDRIDISESNIEDGKAHIVNYEGGKALSYSVEVAPGTYTVEVKRVGEDTGVVLASASRTVVVYSGLTTTISGSVEEDTTSGRFDINDDFVINTKEDLILFRDLVNEVGVNFSGKIVKLAANIDLAGIEWTPIGTNADGANKFQGIFDGQGHTISNMTVNQGVAYHAAGFFGALNGTAKNIIFDNATVTSISAPNTDGNTDNGTAVVAGSIYTSGSIEGVTVKNSRVSGNRYVGGISGYTYGSVRKCTVENTTVTSTPDNLTGTYDNGDKAGGVVGAFWHENTHKISGNIVNNVTVKGYRDIGGIVGYANGNVTDNAVNGLTLIQDYSILTTPRTTVEDVIGRHDGFEVDASNTANNVKVIRVYKVSTNEELNQAISAANKGDTITLSNDIALTEPLTIGKSVTLEGNGSYTISGYPVSVSTDANVTFNKVNFATPDNDSKNASSVYASGLTGELVFKECTFTNPQWECIQITPMDGAKIVVNNCSFIVDGDGIYAQANGTKVERLLHIQNTADSGNYTATITNNSFIGVDLCRNAVIDVDDIAAFGNVNCGGNTFANHDGTTVDTLPDGMIYININGLYDTANVATDTYVQFVQTPAAELHH